MLKGEEYIRNADFGARHERGNLVDWSRAQHANSKSFELDIADGELTIRKIGHEPWLILTQVIDPEPLLGKIVVFSAELKMDLRTPEVMGTREMGGGLRIMAERRTPTTGQYKAFFRSVFDHEPHMGQSDWQQAQVVFKVPVKTERLVVGFAHQADGVLQVRKPSLRRANQAAAPCPRTPITD